MDPCVMLGPDHDAHAVNCVLETSDPSCELKGSIHFQFRAGGSQNVHFPRKSAFRAIFQRFLAFLAILGPFSTSFDTYGARTVLRAVFRLPVLKIPL